MVRVIIKSVVEGVIKRFSATGRVGEDFTDREYFQHYGYTSRPKPGAEGVIDDSVRNHIIMVASDDRRYRIAIEEGEVALYDDQGQVVKLKRGKEVHIYGCDKLTADVGVETKITCPLVRIVAATKVRLETPLLEVTGEIRDRCDSSGRTMSDMRGIYNGHTHPENNVNGGSTNAPNQGM
jgi:phage gp45-like